MDCKEIKSEYDNLDPAEVTPQKVEKLRKTPKKETISENSTNDNNQDTEESTRTENISDSGEDETTFTTTEETEMATTTNTGPSCQSDEASSKETIIPIKNQEIEIECGHQQHIRAPVKAESLIRMAITRMNQCQGNHPGMASAKSITDLISAELGWPTEYVHERVQGALDRAEKAGKVIRIEDETDSPKCSYVVADKDVKNNIRALRRRSTKTRQKLLKTVADSFGNHLDTDYLSS